MMPANHPTKNLGKRVDAIVIAYALTPFVLVTDELFHAGEIATERGAHIIQFEAQGLAFEVGKMTALTRVSFHNADVRCLWVDNAAGGWQLEVVPYASYLATHTLAETIGLCRRVAECFGEVHEHRIRRVDLCADFEHFPLKTMGQEAIYTTRSSTMSFRTEAKDVGELDHDGESDNAQRVREYRAADTSVTGYVVSPGNPLLCRIYDKTVELKQPGREGKKDLEEAIWTRNGWDGSDVTRVEFQLRGVMLDEAGLRDPEDLQTKLDAVWQYTTRWVRLIDVASATRRKRCALLPCWDVVQHTHFAHDDAPIRRERKRGGATAAHVFGALLSYLATKAALKLDWTGDAEAMVNHLDFEALEYVRARYQDAFKTAFEAVLADTVQRYGWREACVRLLGKEQAVHARFFESDNPASYFSAAKSGDLEPQRFDSLSIEYGKPIKLADGSSYYPDNGEGDDSVPLSALNEYDDELAAQDYVEQWEAQ